MQDIFWFVDSPVIGVNRAGYAPVTLALHQLASGELVHLAYTRESGGGRANFLRLRFVAFHKFVSYSISRARNERQPVMLLAANFSPREDNFSPHSPRAKGF